MKDIISVTKNGPVATVTIDRGEKRNALNQEMVLALTQIALDFQNDTAIQCVVLSGSKTAFS
ncbi:MAG TPA: enoyl-CoA hydratase/isomerase family protein, partial [Advenella sp.]|nr:enoyl-CoA hydratase/isomerase family protein [Advenella sp.]